jgi:ornithine cyclodeaminase
MKIVTRAEIEALLDPSHAMSAVEEGFRRFSAGAVQLSAVGHLGFPERGGDCHIKAAHLASDETFTVKVSTGFHGNAEEGLSTSNGFVALLSATTGALLAIFLDEGLITDFRTAVAGAIAAKLIAPPQLKQIGVVGTGIQARLQARHAASATGCSTVCIWGRDGERSAALAAGLRGDGLDASAAASVEALCETSGLIITATASREPLVMGAMLRRGARIVAVGADAPAVRRFNFAMSGTW